MQHPPYILSDPEKRRLLTFKKQRICFFLLSKTSLLFPWSDQTPPFTTIAPRPQYPGPSLQCADPISPACVIKRRIFFYLYPAPPQKSI